eukprot:Gregarina_sp_Poly_1__2903@NODE_180_length_11843_cov_115_676376_g160_i0_p7_GENE_NODE_180_length_11843_cov_115_676376_g160_i0NODE_180_length_11843_cov_115_676376_g160_i0_p7_ORF_typecomplete_len169_score29_37DUF1043/PF06295_12/0_19DUF1043/PF06295_12/7_8e03_NODE_180_length_11843_cov_115_676376_g160_i083128818
MLVIIALSGVFFLASFHIGYFVLKFFEALVRDTKKEQAQREQAEKLLAEFAAESIDARSSILDDSHSFIPNDRSTISLNFAPRQRGFTGFMQRRKIGDEVSDADQALSTVSGDKSKTSQSRSHPPSPLLGPHSEAASRSRRRFPSQRPSSYMTDGSTTKHSGGSKAPT